MSRELTHSPFFKSIVSSCAKLYTEEPIFLAKDALVIFTCGASSGNKNKSVREQLLRYAERYFSHGTLFLAEDVFRFIRRTRKDLLTIENKLADYSDCVLIINESPGTLAELGAFASNQNVVKKLLVVNSKEFADIESFINLGPVARINKKSIFKDAIYVDLSSAAIYFDAILGRIKEHAARKRRQRVDFSMDNAWRKNELKLRLLLLQDILNLFCPLTIKELINVMNSLFQNQPVNFEMELGLLTATKKVIRKGGVFIATRSCANHSYSISERNWLGLRKKIIDLYKSQDKNRLLHLDERSKGLQ